MPMFEYQCKDCGHRFEALVFGNRTPVCPACKSDAIEKQFSTFGMGGGSNAGGPSRSAPCGPVG